MTTPPELSPDLRPVRYCPNCGQRVAQKAEDCFMCGYDLRVNQRRSFSLPVRDLRLVVVVIGVAYLWWTRGGQSRRAGWRQPPTATATATATARPTCAATCAASAFDIDLRWPTSSRCLRALT